VASSSLRVAAITVTVGSLVTFCRLYLPPVPLGSLGGFFVRAGVACCFAVVFSYSSRFFIRIGRLGPCQIYRIGYQANHYGPLDEFHNFSSFIFLRFAGTAVLSFFRGKFSALNEILVRNKKPFRVFPFNEENLKGLCKTLV